MAARRSMNIRNLRASAIALRRSSSIPGTHCSLRTDSYSQLLHDPMYVNFDRTFADPEFLCDDFVWPSPAGPHPKLQSPWRKRIHRVLLRLSTKGANREYAGRVICAAGDSELYRFGHDIKANACRYVGTYADGNAARTSSISSVSARTAKGGHVPSTTLAV